MSATKAKLRAAREFIKKKDYANAKQCSLQVLDFEPDEYHALVFLGISQLELGEFKESEQAYRKATEVAPDQALAWQGLAKFYEQQEEWEKYVEILTCLLDFAMKEQDPIKCAETIQKLAQVRRNHGTPSQLVTVLRFYLPSSKFYGLLSTLPPPSLTNPTSSTTLEAQEAIHNDFQVLQEILKLTQAQEEERFEKEVGKRRMRIGAAGPEAVRREVGLEMFGSSELPALYDAVLNHPNTPDEFRVEIERKQLRHKYNYLAAIPNDRDTAHIALKHRLSMEVDDLVDTIVLLRKQDELGWTIYFQGRDCNEMSGYDRAHIREYISLFPDSPLASLWKGYFAYVEVPLWNDDDTPTLSPLGDPVDTVMTAYMDLSDSILGNRIVAEIHLSREDYEDTIKTAKHGLQVLNQYRVDSGKTLQQTRTALQVILATALIHFFPPKHHKEATRIVNEVLTLSPSNPTALMGRGFILQATSTWEGAMEAFDRVFKLTGNDDEKGITLNATVAVLRGLRAREESAWCLCQLGRHEEALSGLETVLQRLNASNGGHEDNDDTRFDSDIARCLWRMGECLLASECSREEEAYQYFIQALKKDSEFAPAFTSLGTYYLEHTNPPDPIRSSKCFEKAFELDARETLAARRLTEGFANEKEWDLVEVVAQRTIDGEGGLNAGLDKSELDADTKYLPMNIWAWKARGVVRFHYKDYPGAIQDFQVCLRVDPEDQSLWVRLGEAYAKAGRQAAAVKALKRASELQPDDWVCSYITAEVKYQMGLFEDAILILSDILQCRPNEAGPLMLIGRVHLDLGLAQLAGGFRIRAEESFLRAIRFALDIMGRVIGFRSAAWKLIGDAATHLSKVSTFTAGDAIRSTLRSIQYLSPPDWAEKVVKIVGSPSFQDGTPIGPLTVATAAIHAYLSQLSLALPNQSHFVGWYDFSVALESWSLLTHKSTSPEDVSFIKEKVFESLKKAVQADPGNDIYWVGLGNAYFATHAKEAQHAYIKALEIDSRNAETWVNLGLLYFYHEDVELANEAFYRAQVLDPDNSTAWVGQFLVAKTNDDREDATRLLEHAVNLVKPMAAADYAFAFRVFDDTSKEHRPHRVLDALLPVFFVLDRYCQTQANDATALHLSALVCERLGHHIRGAELVERSISILEAMYEETEDPEVEMKYTIANCTLGRLRLSLGEFVEAATLFESAHGLLADKNGDGSADDDRLIVMKVQAYLGMGLANYFLGNLETALDFLERGLALANDDLPLRSQVVILLAQILWTIGTEDAKDAAKSRLLECIASDPENLSAINTLAGMGILTRDDNLVDAALSELLALPIEHRHSVDPQRSVDYLLIQHHLAQKDAKIAVSVTQRAVYAEPSNLEQRNRLARLIVRDGGNKAGCALLAGTEEALSSWSSASFSAAGSSTLSSQALTDALHIQSVALAESTLIPATAKKESILLGEALSKAQRAIMLRPWDLKGWQTLAYVRSRMV